MKVCFYGELSVLNKNKFDISKTFDIFNSDTVNVLKDKLVKLVFVEAENIFLNKSCIMADISSENNTYLTVLNNHKVFNLLNNYIKKQNKKNDNENY